jgi:hypothetical protein
MWARELAVVLAVELVLGAVLVWVPRLEWVMVKLPVLG